MGVEFTKQRMGEHQVPYGPLKLYINDQVVAEGQLRTMTGHFALCGEGLGIGARTRVGHRYPPTAGPGRTWSDTQHGP